MTNSSAPQETDGDRSEEHTGIRITRRDALIGAATVAAVKSLGVGAVAAEGDEEINTDYANYDDDEIYYHQFADGSIDSFILEGGDDGVIMQLESFEDDIDDDYVTGEVYLAINGGDREMVGDHTIALADVGSVIEYTQEDLWGSDEPFDFEQLDSIEEGYANINVDVPEPGDDDVGVPRNETEFVLEFQIISSNGSISKNGEIEFVIDITPPLGFGSMYGVNYGRDHVEDWPDDWYDN